MNFMSKLGVNFLLSASLMTAIPTTCWAKKGEHTPEEFKSLTKLNYICAARSENHLKFVNKEVKARTNETEKLVPLFQMVELCGWTEDTVVEGYIKWARAELPIPGFQVSLVGAGLYFFGYHVFPPTICILCGSEKKSYVQSLGDQLMLKLDDVLIATGRADFFPWNSSVKSLIRLVGVAGVLYATYKIKWEDDPLLEYLLDQYLGLKGYLKLTCNPEAWREAPLSKIIFVQSHPENIDEFYRTIAPGGDPLVEDCKEGNVNAQVSPKAGDAGEKKSDL